MQDRRMTRILTTIVLLIGLNASGQVVRIDTLYLPKVRDGVRAQTKDMKFPVIRTGNKKVDSVMNKDLKNRFTDNEFPELSTDSAIVKWGEDRVGFIDFEVTYRKNGLLSFNITAEGCGAYCTSWTNYFNYSTITGKFVSIAEIVDTTGKFKAMIIADKSRQYKEQRNELKGRLLDKEYGIDTVEYKWALEYYNNCEKDFQLTTFSLYADHLEIIADCDLPHAITSLMPIIELKYKYRDIAPYLRRKKLATP